MNKILEFSKNVLVQNELHFLKMENFEQKNYINEFINKSFYHHYIQKSKWTVGSKKKCNKKYQENSDESNKILSSKISPLSNNDCTDKGNSKVLNSHSVIDIEKYQKK